MEVGGQLGNEDGNKNPVEAEHLATCKDGADPMIQPHGPAAAMAIARMCQPTSTSLAN